MECTKRARILLWIALFVLATQVPLPAQPLPPELPTTLTILDAHSGEPVGGGEVYLVLPPRPDLPSNAIENSDPDLIPRTIGDDGIVILDAPPGVSQVHVRATGCLPEIRFLSAIPDGIVHVYPGTTVRGRVFGSDGQPLAGARVTVHSELKYRAAYKGERITAYGSVAAYLTGPDGGFTATMLPSPFLVQAWGTEDSPGTFVSRIYEPATTPSFLEIRLRSDEERFGRVVDDQGTGIGGVALTFRWQFPVGHPDDLIPQIRRLSRAVSDADGHFTVHAPEGATISVFKARHPEFSEQRNEADDPLRIILSRGVRLSGRVVAHELESEELPRHGKILQRLEKYEWLEEAVSFEIDADGRFETQAFEPIRSPADRTAGELLVPGFETVAIEWGDEAQLYELGELTLSRGAPTEVWVSDIHGDPVAGVEVMLRRGLSGRGDQSMDRALTDANGRVLLYGVAGVKYPAFEIIDPRYRKLKGRFEIEDGPHHLTLHAVEQPTLGSIRGRVIDHRGRPIEGARIHVWPSATSYSRADGRFVLEGVAVRAHRRVKISAPGHERVEEKFGDNLDEDLDLGDVELIAFGRVEGRVFDSGGNSVPRARLKLKGQAKPRDASADGRPRGERALGDRRRPVRQSGAQINPQSNARTDSRGQFGFDLPAGTYQVVGRATGLVPSKPIEVIVAPGTVTKFDLSLIGLLGETVDREIQVLDHDGRPVPDASLRLTISKGDSGSGFQTKTLADGVATFVDLPRGSAHLAVSCPGYLSRSESFGSRDALPTEFVLDRGAIIELELVVSDDRELPSTVSFHEPRYGILPRPPGGQRGAFPVIDGRVTISGCTEQKYTFRVAASEFGNSDEIVVTPKQGEVAVRTVVLPDEARPVHFRVRDTTGAPVVGASVSVSNGSDVFYGSVETNELGVATYPRSFGYRLIVSVHSPFGYTDTSLDNFMLHEKDRFVDLTVEWGGTVTVHVFEPDGTPSTNCVVNRTGYPSDGVVFLGNTAAGPTRLVVNRPGERSTNSFRFGPPPVGEYLGELNVEVASGEEHEVAFFIAPMRPVKGVVRLDGVPSGGGTIGTKFASAEVGEDGTFEVGVRGEGTFEFTLRRPGVPDASRTFELTNDSTDPISFDLKSVRISGVVRTPNGDPAPAITIELCVSTLRGPKRSEVQTSDDGSFSFEPVPTGPYRLVVASEPWFPSTFRLHAMEDRTQEIPLLPKRSIEVPTKLLGSWVSLNFCREGHEPIEVRRPSNSRTLTGERIVPDLDGWLVGLRSDFRDETVEIAWCPAKDDFDVETVTWIEAGALSFTNLESPVEIRIVPRFETDWPVGARARTLYDAKPLTVPSGRYEIRLTRGQHEVTVMRTVTGSTSQPVDVEEAFAELLRPEEE